jgi:hypothetical protein
MSTHPTRSNAALAARANAIAGRGRIVPVADHRTIRLSVESNALLAARYRCHERTISGIRTGSIGVPLSVDERRARLLRAATGVPYRPGDHQLLVGYRFGGGILAWQDGQERRDAAHECRHGGLPGDTGEPCGCWPSE